MKLAEEAMLLNCIKEILGSNFSRDADYPGRDFFVIFIDRFHFRG
jgi:hypothetical protein